MQQQIEGTEGSLLERKGLKSHCMTTIVIMRKVLCVLEVRHTLELNNSGCVNITHLLSSVN